MRKIDEINAEITAVKNELEDVHGREAEVYTRIVGYYRSVRNWNKGKREEYGHRKMFSSENSKTSELASNCVDNIDILDEHIENAGNVAKLEVYTRTTCPNCPPVMAYCKDLNIPVIVHNVDSAEGFTNANNNVVRSAPTVILYNEQGEELNRVYSVSELESALNYVQAPVAVNA
ncbi:MAG: hypothetical protein CR988_04650 [Treponema sp.]|nr:MAG: hypothetical protein CR988_04650 [Treponema sp.]